jgi:urease accessory protein
VKAAASVITSRTSDGGSRCTTLQSAPPLTLRNTTEGLHLVGTAAGPVGGDALHLDVRILPGACLTVRSAAAQIVLPGPSGAASSWDVAADVGAGATLQWLPQPSVIAKGADHRMSASISLASGAQLVWREEVRLGRFDECAGSVVMSMRVDRDDHPLLRHEVAMGPRWPDAAGPAGIGPAVVVATVLLVGAPAVALFEVVNGAAAWPAIDGARAGVFELASDVAMVAVLGRASEPVRVTLAELGVE